MDLTNVPEHCKAGIIAMNAGKPLAHTSPEEASKDILNKYIDGKGLIEQAKEIGVSPCRLNQILLQAAEGEWREAQIAKAITTLDMYEVAIENATDGLSVTRAREGARLAQWKLERLLARLFAQKQIVSTNVTVSVDAVLIGRAGDLLDAIK